MSVYKPLVLKAGEFCQLASGDILDLVAFRLPDTLGVAGEYLSVVSGDIQLAWVDNSELLLTLDSRMTYLESIVAMY
jgi:hypothetical protein